MSTWILLRGWAREARHWGPFPGVLQAAFPAMPVVALDLPGSGELHDDTSPLSIAAGVEHCRETLRARAIAPPYHLLGLSLGAMTCIEWASRHPQEIGAAVLLNTSVRPFSSFHRRLRPGNYGTLFRLVFLERDPAAREAAVLRLTSSAAIDAATVDAWARFARERPMSRANALRQLLAAARYRAPDRAPPVPLLVLGGGGDTLVDPCCSVDLARAWALPFVQHPGAGHDLTLDDGPWVARQVKRWLTPS